MPAITRRSFLQTAATFAASIPGVPKVSPLRPGRDAKTNTPFRVAVISDEISHDFDHACSVIANDFGLEWVELRGLWNKNILNLDQADTDKALAILAKYKLQVTDIASPLFKTDWPDAPRSRYSQKSINYGAKFPFKEQDEVLDKCIAAARQFKTERIRCFDFWRLADQSPYRAAIDAKLQEAATKVSQANLVLVLENEYECNTATGREAARTLAAVPAIMLNWDPGNAVARGETDAFPAGFEAIPKDRIGHCHVKGAIPKPGTKDGFSWAPVGQGLPDWTQQFRALRQIGYTHAVSLETHWSGGGSPEASSRVSWAGMKAALESA